MFVILVYICTCKYNKIIFFKISPFHKNQVGGLPTEEFRSKLKVVVWQGGTSFRVWNNSVFFTYQYKMYVQVELYKLGKIKYITERVKIR